MRVFTIAFSAFLGLAPLDLFSQDCKPEVSTQDKITKQQVKVWRQSIWSTSFASAVVNTNESEVTVAVGLYGEANAVSLIIQKKEESATNAAFDAAYRGAQGLPFYFGLKSGDPLSFMVTEVSNAANVKQGLFAAKGVTTVVLGAVLSDEEMRNIRAALTSQPVDAVRLSLSGGIQLEKSVNEKNGQRLMAKFACFYQAWDQRGATTAQATAPVATERAPNQSGQSDAPGGTDGAAPMIGKYRGQPKASNRIELRSDGTFAVLQNGYNIVGTFAAQADTITLTPSRGREKPRAVFNGRTLRFLSDGSVYEKEGQPTKASVVVTVDQVIQMATAKLAEDIILATIRKSSAPFDLSPDALIKLKTAGVSDAVIRAMSQHVPPQ